MADFNGFTEEVGKVVSTVVDKAKEFGGVAKVQALIKAEEAKKQDGYYKLGKKYYELYKDAPASDLSDLMDKLLAADSKIAEYKEQLKEMAEAKEAAKAAAEEDDDDEADFEEEVKEEE